ncbi:hypothetical protein J2Z22_002601 [Paenibacillus forsythiae]|uniref:Uncharacterized protein n=1 Tax=Paenibacillus forsythiae TaxID=365616 RepID=A0ABU3HBJ5_9BACL|nr:hypothetical protein [Paenibacillus forsythiae]MDT3427065.1 hypothetical protein [Paenibacillus forsythiae]
MENKRWRFKVPGATDSKEFIMDTREIKSAYDILKKWRSAEEAPPLEEATASRRESSADSPGKPEAV